MHELLPKARRFAVLVNPANPVTTEATSKALKEAAPGLGIELVFFNAGTPGETAIRGAQLATLTARDRMPASVFSSEVVAAGLLMSYGTSIADVFRQVGVYAGSILKGAKPGELPVLQSTKFEFTLNLQTARSLGIDVPPTLLARADDVIK